MTLKREIVRRGGQVLGTITTGYSDGSSVVRDSTGRVTGHASELFRTTRDSAGRLVANSVKPALLIPTKRK